MDLRMQSHLRTALPLLPAPFPGKQANHRRQLPLLAAVLSVLVAQSALPSVITRQVDITLNAANVESLELDVNHDGLIDFTFTAAFVVAPDLSVGFDVVHVPFATSNGVVIDMQSGDGFPAARLLQVGERVTAANTFSSPDDQTNLFFFTTFDPPSGNFAGRTGFIGLRFDTATGMQFGFAEITVNALDSLGDPLGLTIGTIGFNAMDGQPVQITRSTTVVAPPTLSLVAMCALALFTLRRRRRVGSGFKPRQRHADQCPPAVGAHLHAAQTSADTAVSRPPVTRIA